MFWVEVIGKNYEQILGDAQTSKTYAPAPDNMWNTHTEFDSCWFAQISRLSWQGSRDVSYLNHATYMWTWYTGFECCPLNRENSENESVAMDVHPLGKVYTLERSHSILSFKCFERSFMCPHPPPSQRIMWREELACKFIICIIMTNVTEYIFCDFLVITETVQWFMSFIFPSHKWIKIWHGHRHQMGLMKVSRILPRFSSNAFNIYIWPLKV